MAERRYFSIKERTAYNEQKKQEADVRIQKLAESFEQDPAAIAEYLQFRGRFHQYSNRNMMLAYCQNPAAQYLGSFSFYREQGYTIRKGEHGMTILAPIVYKEYRTSRHSIWRPLNKSTPPEDRIMVRSGAYESRDTLTGWRTTTVFDITQTTCPPEDYPRLMGYGYQSTPHAILYQQMQGLCAQVGRPVREAALPANLRGQCSAHEICINRAMGDTQKLDTLLHELGHAQLGHVGADLSTAQKEFEADAFSILMSYRYGLDVPKARQAHLADAYNTYRQELLKAEKPVEIDRMMERVDAQFERMSTRLEAFLDAVPGLAEELQKADPVVPLSPAAPESDRAQGVNLPPEAPAAAPRLFVDMDGTLAQFHAEDNYLERMWEAGFFERLQPYQNAVDGLRQYMQTNPDTEVYILSSAIPGDPPACVAQKNAWLDKYLPEIDRQHRLFPAVGEDKAAAIPGGIRPTDTLLDDYNVNLSAWRDAGGHSIKFVNHINDHARIGARWDGDRAYYDHTSKQLCAELSSALPQGVNLPPELDPAVQPVVTILHSQHAAFTAGDRFPLAAVDERFAAYDQEQHGQPPKEVAYRVDYTFDGQTDYFMGTYEVGRGSGTLIRQMHDAQAQQLNDPAWRSYVQRSGGRAALEAEMANGNRFVTEVIRYFEESCGYYERPISPAEQGVNLPPETPATDLSNAPQSIKKQILDNDNRLKRRNAVLTEKALTAAARLKARMPHISLHNLLQITQKRPDALYVATAAAFEKVGLHIRSGEKPMRLTVSRVSTEIKTDKGWRPIAAASPVEQAEAQTGQRETRSVTKDATMMVYDLRQTDCPPATLRTYEQPPQSVPAEQLVQRIGTCAASRDIPVEHRTLPSPELIGGYDTKDQCIVVNAHPQSTEAIMAQGMAIGYATALIARSCPSMPTDRQLLAGQIAGNALLACAGQPDTGLSESQLRALTDLPPEQQRALLEKIDTCVDTAAAQWHSPDIAPLSPMQPENPIEPAPGR